MSEADTNHHARNQARYRLAMTCLIGLAVLGAYDTFVPDGWWRKVPGKVASVVGELEQALPTASPSPTATPRRTPAPRPTPQAPPPPPQDLPLPYPTLRASGEGRPFVAGPLWRSKSNALADHARKVVHVARWPEELVALDPATGDTVYTHAAGHAPLAVVGNRLLALGEQRLWILDTLDGAPVYELPLALLPPLLDARYRPSAVEVTEHAGPVVVVRVHVEQQPNHDPRAYADMKDRELAAKQAREHFEAARARARADAQDYAFGLDVEAGRVVACPPTEAREPVSYDFRLEGMVISVQGGLQARREEEPRNGQPHWVAGLRRLFARPPEVRPPDPPLPEPWPQPRATGDGSPFELGPAYRQLGWGALADPQRGVYHLMGPTALIAVDPHTGEVVYTHAQGDEPVAVLGNRLLARSEGTLWILDTHDGAAVFELTAPQLPPLLSTERRWTQVFAGYAQGSVLLVQVGMGEAPTHQPGEVERRPWTSTRYAFGLDMASGQVVTAPVQKRQEPSLEEGKRVRHFRLDMHNNLARGRDVNRWDPPLWELELRDLRLRDTPRVEAEDGAPR